MPASFGFVGTGEIAAAIVEGLHADGAEPPTVHLSPRGQRTAHELAGRFPDVHVCASNQAVVDNAEAVVLAVPPKATRTVLEELSFGPRHVVLSAVVGVRLDRLSQWASSAGRVVRVVPLPQAAHRQSLTATYPDDAAAHDLFDRVGRLLVASDEESLDALSAATATFAAHLDYLTTIASWLTDHGVPGETATAFVTHVFAQLGRSLSDRTDALAALTDKHTTPGGINEQLMTDLRRGGVPDLVRHALDRVLCRLRDDQA